MTKAYRARWTHDGGLLCNTSDDVIAIADMPLFLLSSRWPVQCGMECKLSFVYEGINLNIHPSKSARMKQAALVVEGWMTFGCVGSCLAYVLVSLFDASQGTTRITPADG